jgi:hypothetical protein
MAKLQIQVLAEIGRESEAPALQRLVKNGGSDIELRGHKVPQRPEQKGRKQRMMVLIVFLRCLQASCGMFKLKMLNMRLRVHAWLFGSATFKVFNLTPPNLLPVFDLRRSSLMSFA